jgi:hypothetical protein
MRVRLHDVAHARAGDKGTLNMLTLTPYDLECFPALARAVTAEVVAAHLAERFPGEVTRYELPNLRTLIFVCRRAAGDSVTTSLRLDAHGKSLSSALLELEVTLGAT